MPGPDDPDDRLPDDIQAEIDARLAEHDDEADQIAAMDAAAQRARDVQTALYRMEVQEAARRKKAAQERDDQERPQLVRLDHLLQRQYDTPTYRIDDLWPTGGRMLLAAQWKTGKSTLVGNLVRALVDGDQFLGRYLPRQAGRVVLIDDELDERTLQLWFREQHIDNVDRVDLLPLRGRVSAFDILDPDSRAEWAKDLAGADVVILDCLRPIFDAFGLDENHEAGRFLVALDALLADAGVDECGVVHHMGHQNERSRGDSRLLDWPDTLWKIVRDKDDEDEAGHADDPTGSRYFSAYGRDVDQPQAELIYHRATRRLELGTKTRHQNVEQRKVLRADQAVMSAVERQPGVNKNGLKKTAANFGVKDKQQVDDAVERLVEAGHIIREVRGQQHFHYLGSTVQALQPPTTEPNPPGSVNQPLTWDYPPTEPETDSSGGSDRNGSGGSGGSDTDRSGADTEPPSRSSYGSVSELGNRAEPSRTETGSVCPECDHNQLTPGLRICSECEERHILEAMPDD